MNNIFLTAGNKHVKNSILDSKEIYGNNSFCLWNKINKFLMAKVTGNYETMMKPPVEYLGMKLVYPFMDVDLVNYCFSLKPEDVYNKKPMRQLMREYGIPEVICKRGEDWSVGYGGKVGWGPNIKEYFEDRKIIDILYKIPNVDDVLKEYFTDYVIKNLKKWKDRRVIQIGLFLQQMLKRT